MIVFGSEYRTAPGTVKPGIPAHKLLLGGPAAIAIAPADLRSRPSVSVNTVGLIDEGDEAAGETARSLAAALGARSSSTTVGPVDLLVVGSRPESPAGRSTLSAASDYAVETATQPVLVVPRGIRAQLRRGSVPAGLSTRITAATDGSRPSIRARPSDHSIGAGLPPRPSPAGASSTDSASTARTAAAARGSPPPRSSAWSRPRPSATRSTNPARRRGPGLRASSLEDRQLALARFPLLFAQLEGLIAEPRGRGFAAARRRSTLKTRA